MPHHPATPTPPYPRTPQTLSHRSPGVWESGCLGVEALGAPDGLSRYRASVHVASGLYSCIAFAISVVRGPRSFWYTLPWWLTRNVMTPVFRYSAGNATRANPAIMFPLIT